MLPASFFAAEALSPYKYSVAVYGRTKWLSFRRGTRGNAVPIVKMSGTLNLQLMYSLTFKILKFFWSNSREHPVVPSWAFGYARSALHAARPNASVPTVPILVENHVRRPGRPACSRNWCVSAGVVWLLIGVFLCRNDLLLLPVRVVGPYVLHDVRQSAEACSKPVESKLHHTFSAELELSRK